MQGGFVDIRLDDSHPVSEGFTSVLVRALKNWRPGSAPTMAENGTLMIRPGGEADLPAINELYNHYVRETHITFDLVPKTMAERMEWFRTFATTGRYRLLVAVEDDEVLGYASSRPYAQKAAYETSIETSIYLRADATGRGIGTRLHADLLVILEGEDVHRAYAGIAIPNPASIALHERLGFTQVAYFSEQGRKFGRYWDVAWYERPVGSQKGITEAG